MAQIRKFDQPKDPLSKLSSILSISDKFMENPDGSTKPAGKAVSAVSTVGSAMSGNVPGVVAGAKKLQNQSNEVKNTQVSSAMDRRLENVNEAYQGSQDLLKTMTDTEQAFNQLPQEHRREFAQPYFQTMSAMANDYKKQRGGVNATNQFA